MPLGSGCLRARTSDTKNIVATQGTIDAGHDYGLKRKAVRDAADQVGGDQDSDAGAGSRQAAH